MGLWNLHGSVSLCLVEHGIHIFVLDVRVDIHDIYHPYLEGKISRATII